MDRIRLFEITDQAWCPSSVRDGVTDALQFALCLGNHYGCVVPRIQQALRSLNTQRIVDLCSGGGGPWPRLIRTFEEEGTPVRVYLTDKFLNKDALCRARAGSQGRIDFHSDPVDALSVSPELAGFRTLFSSFHHFPPAQARAILWDAVRNGRGIGVFEFTQRGPFALLFLCLTPLLILSIMPFIRPFRWTRLAWTYLLPVIPFAAWFDGIVSCLHTYSPVELKRLTEGLSEYGYTWDIGYENAGWASPIPITYLIGYRTDQMAASRGPAVE
jgi:hypothetical protein